MWAKSLQFLSVICAALSDTNNIIENQSCEAPSKDCSYDSKYRTSDGSCNNLQHPYWGSKETPYERLVAYNYGDDIHALPKAKSGKPLPNARLISQSVFRDKHVEDNKRTLAHMSFGAVIAHDQSLAAGTSHISSGKKCCVDGKLGEDSSNSDKCAPIMIEDEDEVYAPAGIECLDFERSGTDKDKGCHSDGQPFRKLNTVTSFLDLSVVYGSSDEQAESLRTFTGGRLKVNCYHGDDFLPQVDNVKKICPAVRSQEELCFKAGDDRVNQNPQLSSFHVLLLREHNRVADILSKLNPDWCDDQVYNEARRITISEYQHIIYKEYLPLLLGIDTMKKLHLLPAEKGGCVNDYDPTVNPTMIDEHTHAAFKVFHSAVSGHLKLVSPKREVLGEARLSDWFNRPESLAFNSTLNYDTLCTGLATQTEEKVDQYFDKEVTNFLFRLPHETLGTDLRALDIQRSRDHGIGTYNQMREHCNLAVPKSFDELSSATGISEENVEILKSLYEDVDDLDLAVAGTLEPHVSGTNAGATYICIIGENFKRARKGDRFYYESCAEGKFTTDQLKEIRKSSVSRLFCDNVETITEMQLKGFEPVGPE
nr:Peroxidase [Metisa plana]